VWFAAWLSPYRKPVTAGKRREERPCPSPRAIEIEVPLASIPGFFAETDWRDGVNSDFIAFIGILLEEQLSTCCLT